MEKEQMSVKEVFESVGGRQAYALLMRQCGFKAYSALLANWEKANAVPKMWSGAVESVEKRFGNELPMLKRLKPLIREATKIDFGARRDFSNNEMSIFVTHKFGSMKKFIAHLKERYGLRLQRKQVYDWYWFGVQDKPTRIKLMMNDGFPEKVLNGNQTPTTEIDPNDLF